jgi:glycosyltransferase involved in cell wall biosynthesis
MTRAFPEAPLYTTLYEPETAFPHFEGVDVRTSYLNRYGFLRQHHRLALPLLPAATRSLQVDADIVLCSSSGWAHGITTEGAKIVYCHNPARWLYQRRQYASGRLFRSLVAQLLTPPLRRWDEESAATCRRYLANSKVVAERIKAAYAVEADVVHPPVAMDARAPRQAVAKLEPGYALCVSRLMPYKNVDAVVTAFEALPEERLVVAGDGPELNKIARSAPRNVVFLGRRRDTELRWLYANAGMLVTASFEDFGLTPVEAAAFGVPAALLRWGGFLETGVEGVTALYFDRPAPQLIAQTVRQVRRASWDHDAIRLHAMLFDEAHFSSQLHSIVAETLTAA